jgi:HSP20 family molecular chaperone IbpA
MSGGQTRIRETGSREMEEPQELSVQEKKETSGQERPAPGRYFVPSTDAHETEGGLTLVMEMPGVRRENLEVTLEEGVLKVEGRLDFSRYDGLEPVYTEYNVGHYERSFALSEKVDQQNIGATLENGVLTLTLPKSPAARPRRIDIS